MSNTPGIGALLVVVQVLSTGACAGSGQDAGALRREALAEVIAAEGAFAAYASDSSVQQAFEAFIASDGILFRPGPVDGEGALAAQPAQAGLALLWEPAFADASLAGDLGYTTGPWRAGQRGMPADSMPAAGQYVTLWRRTPAGFRYALDAGIGHDPSLVRAPERVTEAELPSGSRAALDPEQARESLLIADQDLGQALAAGDPAAYRAYSADGVRVLRDGAAPAFGADALIAAALPFAVETVPENCGVAASDDLGYTYGVVKAAGDGEAGPAAYYLRIWRRQADESWKLVLDLVTAPPG